LQTVAVAILDKEAALSEEKEEGTKAADLAAALVAEKKSPRALTVKIVNFMFLMFGVY
jgi:hypothetical protein